MSRKILLEKATRVEGNADILIEVEEGEIKIARFLVGDFRGFERFCKGRRVEFVPQLISRVCGLCSSSHQVASLKAIEEALSVEVPASIKNLREIIVLGEWIGSHALSYFFLTVPDFLGAAGGVFELMKTHPEIATEAFALRKAGQRIVELLGKRASHPVAMGIGRFLIPPTESELEQVQQIAAEVQVRARTLLVEAGKIQLDQDSIELPPDQEALCLIYDGREGQDVFRAYSKEGRTVATFAREEFEENVAEMRAEWTFAKFPYLRSFGFPAGMVLVGPFSRKYLEGGFLDDPEIASLEIVASFKEKEPANLESYDVCRLAEILWAAKRIEHLLTEVDLKQTAVDVDFKVSGKGIGVLEAPRGVLVHSYLVKRGYLERMRLLVATQFNNAYINLLIKDLAQKHLHNDRLSPAGERLIGRCVRIFDPCLSCATH
ncbi:MAG: Ni/Fe hydrogenase subunit alpha [Deltaproteobacteria bacterium]|nr:Ni/Fe hydrogenase subunit alpha [Deltaproteobacteria bacterium]MBW2071009.1 Ni/Fe hydrogenase subunit alpha [Deltaproteobacteria bacterium]